MQESRQFIMRFSKQEVLEALKSHYSHNVAVQAIPLDDMKLAALQSGGISLSWVKQMRAMEG